MATNSFSAGQVLRLNYGDGLWYLAQANNVVNAEATGVVEYATSSLFYIVYNGLITFNTSDINNLVPGDCLFLSPTVAGATTSDNVSALNTVSKPIMRAVSSNVAVVVNERGILNTSDNVLNSYVPATYVTNAYYTATPSDYFIGVNVGGQATVTLPVGTPGKTYTIKDMSGNANTTTNLITISATNPDLIDGSTFDVIDTPYETVSVIYIGGMWNLV